MLGFLIGSCRKSSLVSFSINIYLLGINVILRDSLGLYGSHEILHTAAGSNCCMRKYRPVNLLTVGMCDCIHEVNFNKENPAENQEISASLSKIFNLFFSCNIK